MANEKRPIDANAFECVCVNGKSDDFCNGVLYVLDMIDAQPTVDAVEVVHGHWVNTGGHRKMDLHCSVCNRRASNFVGGYEDWWDLWMPKYCPNCGAKMDLEVKL